MVVLYVVFWCKEINELVCNFNFMFYFSCFNIYKLDIEFDIGVVF